MPINLWGAFYYIAHIENVPGILCHGILTLHEVQRRGLTHRDVADPDVQDRREEKLEPVYGRSIHDYVPLYINPRNPMLYRLCRTEGIADQLVILEVSPKVLLNHAYVFTDGNAACSETRFGQSWSTATLSRHVLEAPTWYRYPDGRRRRCAEVLIHPRVEPHYLTSLVCSSAARAREIREITSLKVRIEPDVFF